MTNVQYSVGQQIIHSSADKAEAYLHLKKLQSGTLIVVLKSDGKKRTELNKVIANSKSSKSQRRRAEKQLKASIRERTNFHNDLVAAFKVAYTFSDYRFVYDNDMLALKEGAGGLLLNHKLEKDPNQQLEKNGAVYFAIEGYTRSSESSRVLSYIVYDFESNQLRPPFPSVKISNIGPAIIFRSLFDKTDYRDCIPIVERFDYLLKHRMASLKPE